MRNIADVDECSGSPCDNNAACSNSDGSFTCTCNDGFTGDGSTCTGEIIQDHQFFCFVVMITFEH